MAHAQAGSDESALLARCREGDLSAFDLLVGAHASKVYNLAYRMLGNAQDAEDAAQDAFLRAFSSIKKFRQNASFSTWMHRIAVNVCLDELKRREKRAEPFSGLNLQQDEGGGLDLGELQPTGEKDDPAECAVARLEQEKVQAALEQLPAQQRAVVIICDLQEFSYEEAAAALETNVGTVKSRLHRARQKLKELLSAGMEQSGEDLGQKR